MPFPGTVGKLSETVVPSAAAIHAKSDIVFVTGAVAIANIHPGWSGFSQSVVLIPLDAGATLVATGNIAVAVAMVQNRACRLTFSKLKGKWYPDIAAV